jgi:protein-disulfide isomerase
MLRKIQLILLFLVGLICQSARAAITIETPAELYFPTVNTVAGNPNGKITVVEFFDYRCVYCRRMPGILEALIKQNPDVRVVYRDYPLLGPQSALAAEAALSAQQQGKYLTFHNALFAVNKPLDINLIRQLATQVGLNEPEMEKDHLSYLTQQQLRENARFASDLGVTGIPTVFVAFTPMSTQHNMVQAYQLVSPKLADLQNVINLLKEPN